MVVIVLTACPVGLRGDLTRWLLEIAPGVFVGHIDARIRDRLWERIIDLLRDGRAVMVCRNKLNWSLTRVKDLMDALLVDGGCIGVICDTVGRAQHAAELLGNHCGRDCVRLTHSRFMDIDRMSNERELRDLLGPDATIGNGKRPGKLVVVGTQVLEQSLDIDFDALVTDIAPVDLIMQRLGRVHRHRRGDGECDRPVSLQTATCYIRGVEAWNNDVFEKMTAWRSSVTQQKKLGLPAPPHMPVVHDAGKALWRGLEPILCASDEGDSRPGLIRWLEEIRTEILESEKHVLDLVTIHAQGMTYGTQSSVFETGIDDTLSLNSVMFRHDYSGIASVLDVVKCTDGAVLALSQFVRNLRAASGDKGKSTETAEQVREYSARNEQHMAFKVYGADWSPVDCDGLQLIKRPKEAKEGSFVGTPRKGWSNASKYRKARKFSKRN